MTIYKTDFSKINHHLEAGSVFSSRFGQSVCFIDFDGDGELERVVGSPLHWNDAKDVDRGMIHLYNFDFELKDSYPKPSDSYPKPRGR